MASRGGVVEPGDGTGAPEAGVVGMAAVGVMRGIRLGGAVEGSAAFRIVGFVDMVGFSTAGDAYTDILVKFNPGYHSYSCPIGL